ncbi:cytochrome P450 [Streptomyces ipomoeae]|uniref:cytochrome P450 n=1 Tax=Streptomyces ipomoeae TaxID=103232 RepID=UPI001146B4BE|nr:cytochrome P450 [Streptomyces ipomoeae]MDX2934495.1 cytochrome P450 [Streptomyces ipomoeae]TQE17385.1 cytochrome P450 [Streptomyces ipomoeae]
MTRPRPLTPGTAAAHPDPYPFYADLVADRPFGHDAPSGLWVAAGAAAVSEVLTHPACRVRPRTEPVPRGILGTPAGDVFGDLVRMTDGAPQTQRKQVLLAALDTVTEERVVALAADEADRATDWTDLQFGLPARVMAAVLGLDGDVPAEAARLIGEFVRCVPASATPEDQAAAATAAARLLDLLGPHLYAGHGGLIGELVRLTARHGRRESAPLLANVIGLLSQTYDATAGLVGNTLLALARHGRPDDLAAFVAEVVRHDAPIQNTRRFVADTTTIAGHRVPAGSVILLLLAAANRDPLANPDPQVFRPGRVDPQVFTFGRGTHRCPGHALAVAMTVGVAATVTGTPSHEGYRPSPNARIPVLKGQFR